MMPRSKDSFYDQVFEVFERREWLKELFQMQETDGLGICFITWIAAKKTLLGPVPAANTCQETPKTLLELKLQEGRWKRWGDSDSRFPQHVTLRFSFH